MRGSAAVSVLLAAGLLAACESSDLDLDGSSPAEGEDLVDRGIKPLSEAQVRVFLSDSTLSHAGEDRIWHVYLAKDGMLYGLSETPDGGEERARGSWFVQPDGQICRQWNGDWSGGTQGCAQVYRFGSQYSFVPDGTPLEEAIRRTRTPGNSENVL